MVQFKLENLEDLKKSGVYVIKNITTDKCYIGSTKMSFEKRLNHHLNRLKNNKHKNTYLQNAWNKYKEDDFEISILEITNKENTLEREQYYLEKYNNLYNINPLATGTPNLSKETIEKRRQTMLKRYKNGELDYLKDIQRQNIPWNKGLTTNEIDYSFLKVKKTLTKKLINQHAILKENYRNNAPNIYVYDLNNIFLGMWRSSKDLEDWSLTNDNNLPIMSRFKVPRMGIPIKHLQAFNINRACNTNKSYKGLYFKYKPLHQVIDDKQQDELLEV